VVVVRASDKPRRPVPSLAVLIRSFAQSGFAGEALESNLFGALLGGVLESVSFWSGLQSLLLLAAAFYLASVVAMLWRQPAAAEMQAAAGNRSL